MDQRFLQQKLATDSYRFFNISSSQPRIKIYIKVCAKILVLKCGSEFVIYTYELVCVKDSSSWVWIKICDPFIWTCLAKNFKSMSVDQNLWSILMILFVQKHQVHEFGLYLVIQTSELVCPKILVHEYGSKFLV